MTAESMAGGQQKQAPSRGTFVRAGTVGLVLAAMAALFAGGCADQGPFYGDDDPLGYGYGYPGYYDGYDYYGGPYLAGGAYFYGGRHYSYPYYDYRRYHRDGDHGGDHGGDRGDRGRTTGGTVSRGSVPWNSPRVNRPSGGGGGSRSSGHSDGHRR